MRLDPRRLDPRSLDLQAALGTLRSPATQTDLVQVVKTVLAAVAAWLVAAHLLDLAQPFLAPWTALLTVHATVHRSLSRGAQSVAATFLGIGLAVVAVALIGLNVVALAVALLVGLLVARLPWLRDEGVGAATTALFVLTTGFEQQQDVLAERFLDVLVGVGIGILVNLLVYPPLNDRSARQQVDDVNLRMGALMQRMAAEMRESSEPELSREWMEETRSIDRQVDHAWALVNYVRESGRRNPRRLRDPEAGDTTGYEQVLHRLEDGVAQLRSLARTVEESSRSAQEWDPRFREPWLEILDDVGRRVADRDADVAQARTRLTDLTWELSAEDLPTLFWPTYGALICALDNVVTIVDDVASQRPVRT